MSASGPYSVAGGVELQYLLVLISVVLASCVTATLIALCIINARYETKTKCFRLRLFDEVIESL